jgi:hypothetical protein
MPYQPAVLGTARLNNFRLNYLSADLQRVRSTKVGIWLSGVRITGAVGVGSLRISDVLNDAPNSCVFTYYGPTPPQPNQKVSVTLNIDHPVTLFSGTLQTIATSYVGRPSAVAWNCAAIDDTQQANRRRPFGSWANISATTVALQLLASFAPALSTAGIEAGLPPVTVMLDGTEGMSGAFAQLAKLIQGYFKFEDGVAYLFTELTTDPCDPIDVDHPFLNEPPVTSSADVSQLRTRVFGKGHAEPTLVDVLAGETILPINDAVMFDAAGGRALALTQRLAYTGRALGGGGTIIGPGVAPAVSPTLTPVSGAGLCLGTYRGAYTFVTASGESLPSPLGTFTTIAATTLPNPTVPSAPPTLTDSPGHISIGTAPDFNATGPPPQIGDVVEYAYSWSTAADSDDLTRETALSPPSAAITVEQSFYWRDSYGWTVPKMVYCYITGYQVAPTGATWQHGWRRRNGGAWQALQYSGHLIRWSPTEVALLQDNVYADSGITPPTPNPIVPGQTQAKVEGIATGPSGTISRNYYRTSVNGTQLKLQQSIAGNTATTGVQDATPDGSLGAFAPGTDTSGLTQATGQINAGATSLPTTGLSTLPPQGWASLEGGQIIRYTGVSGNSVTGIPTTGSGAIVNTVRFGDHLVAVPQLTGVTGITAAILKGTPVNLWVQRDALAAQASQAVIDSVNGITPADGIYEGEPIVDERRGIPSLTALCDATLIIFATAIQTVRYATRDLKTKSGKPVTVNLASPPIAADLVIQDVQISEIDIAPGLAPRFDVTASTTRFSLDNLIRQLAKTLGGQ